MLHRRWDGFTLVELLLALTLMSMLLALAYGGLRASTRATDKGQQILEESSRVRMAHQFVRRQLNQMLPLVFEENEAQTERTVFEGEFHRIRFVAPMPGYLGFGGPQVQEFEFVRGTDGTELVVYHALLQGFEEQHLYERDPIVLIDNIAAGSFDFIGLDEAGQVVIWNSHWNNTNYLPLAVTVEIEFNEDVYVDWPLLTAGVKVDASALADLGADVSVDNRLRTRISGRETDRELGRRREQ
jgi:general secretion pathway protein J